MTATDAFAVTLSAAAGAEPMALDVCHETLYAYGTRVDSAYHLAHLRPLSTPLQHVDAFELEIEPKPLQLTESVDSFGNGSQYFSLHAPHEQLRIVAHSRVTVMAPAPWPVDAPSWEAVRDAFVYRSKMAFDPASEFVFGSQFAPVDPRLAAYAADVFAPQLPLPKACAALMHKIFTEFDYAPDATQVNTGALEALALRRGVCQDFAHLMIGALRSLGLPARYVSGYLLTQPPPGAPRLIGTDASHAWVSVYCPGAGWLDFDPTNDRQPGADYVTLAVGRDYADVAPLKGVLRGGSTSHALKVSVTVMPLDEWLARQAKTEVPLPAVEPPNSI